jgi:ABC-type lipoprotein export system ATPase subunit
VSSILDRLGIRAREAATPSRLSGGEAARAALAVALINEPAVLLADEPTGELDRANAAAVIELIVDHCRRRGTALVVTHDPAVAGRADRVIALRDGRIES